MSDHSHISSLMRHAAAARETGALTEADALYRQILDLEPANGIAIRHRVAIARQLGRPADAIAILEAVERDDRENAAWPAGRALVLASLGRHGEAVMAFDRALALAPLEHALHQGRAASLFADNRFAAAVIAYDNAIAQAPAEHAYHHGRAAALFADDRFADALAGYGHAIGLKPDAVESHIGRGEALLNLCRFEEALAALDDAVACQEDCANAWYAKAQLLLMMGRDKEAWPLHEWRWFTPNFPEQPRLFAQPYWDGAPLDGRTLLVHAEQGLGDSIQFYRFAARVREQGQVVLMVPPRLARLFANQPGGPPVVTESNRLPAFDLHCPMMSLPFFLGSELDTIPPAPYLFADPGLSDAWRARLPPAAGSPRVGIAWAGNKRQARDRQRSMTLMTMLTMLIPGLTVISLQVGLSDADRATLRDTPRVLDLSERLVDFADTAAVIDQLDLVISVDTSVAHLAGALGCPVWVLLAQVADWRWLLDRDDCPWYRSARLFRQDRAGDWTSVAGRVRDALKGLTAS